jgi:NitT/TauT family transport system permease protein
MTPARDSLLAAGLRRLRERPEPLLSLVTFVALILLWELAVDLFGISRLILPKPSAIVSSLWDGFGSGSLTRNFGVTLYEVVAGFAIGAVGGLLLGALISQISLLEKVFYPYVVAFQTVPKVAIAPIIIIWLGFGTFSKVVITATIAFFPILANTIVGLRAAPADQIEMMVSLTANPLQIFWKVRVPQALPYIFVGLDVAIVLAVIGAIVGEFVGAQAGLGYLILQRNLSMDMAGVFAVLVILSAMGVGLHLLVQMLQRRIVFWMDEPPEPTTGA